MNNLYMGNTIHESHGVRAADHNMIEMLKRQEELSYTINRDLQGTDNMLREMRENVYPQIHGFKMRDEYEKVTDGLRPEWLGMRQKLYTDELLSFDKDARMEFDNSLKKRLDASNQGYLPSHYSSAWMAALDAEEKQKTQAAITSKFEKKKAERLEEEIGEYKLPGELRREAELLKERKNEKFINCNYDDDDDVYENPGGELQTGHRYPGNEDSEEIYEAEIVSFKTKSMSESQNESSKTVSAELFKDSVNKRKELYEKEKEDSDELEATVSKPKIFSYSEK